MDFFAAIVLALVQGITAWIPVSSKTQVILVGNAFFAIPFKTALAYAILLHLGDLLAAAFKYRREYASALVHVVRNPLSTLRFSGRDGQALEGNFLAQSIFATALVALPLYLASRMFFSAISGEPLLFVIGLLLLLMAAVTAHSRRKQAGNGEISLKTALLTGAAQGLAVIPGISRSGITQCALLLEGIEPQKALRLSFLMSAPMIAASFAAFYFIEGFSGFSLELVAAGIGVSAIASLFTMDFLTSIARKIPAHHFMVAIGLLAMVPLALKLIFGAAD